MTTPIEWWAGLDDQQRAAHTAAPDQITDPDRAALARVAAAWPDIPEPYQARIIATIDDPMPAPELVAAFARVDIGNATVTEDGQGRTIPVTNPYAWPPQTRDYVRWLRDRS